jgi:hypothetical protein
MPPRQWKSTLLPQQCGYPMISSINPAA